MNKLSENISRLKELIGINESQSLSAPLDGSLHVNSPFGAKRSYEIHPGVDLHARTGTNLKSPLDGKIVVADMNYNKLCGGTIDVEHADGYKSRFCHVSKMMVQKGDIVKKGQVIGLTGGGSKDPGRGNSRGAHLHWSLLKDGKKVDPMKHLNTTVSSSPFGTNYSTTKDNLQGDFDFSNLLGNISNYPNFLKQILKYIFPTIKEQYSSFGKNVSIHSKDILIPAKSNEKIKSPVTGIVQNQSYHSGCKNQVSIMHKINGTNFYLEYCGIENVVVQKGERVSVGTVIGTTDSDVEVYFYNESGKKQYVDDMLKKQKTTSTKIKSSSQKVSPIDTPTKDRSPISLPSKSRSPISLPTKSRGPIDLPSKDRGPL